MTPDEAQHAIRDAEYIGANLPGECWRALDTIAGMSPEYRAEEWQGLVIGWVPTSPWMAEKPVGGTDSHTRVVRRYVTEPEEA